MNPLPIFLTLYLIGLATAKHVPFVAAFYYLWYGNPESDGKWIHWNHAVLPHWDQEAQEMYPHSIRYIPPYDIHSVFYPTRGPYSSSNVTLLREHMRDMKAHGINVAIISWWGRPGVSKGDTQGVLTNGPAKLAFEAAKEEGMKIALHLEPYEGRSVDTVQVDLMFLEHWFGEHPAMFKLERNGRKLPVYFVYDSYHIQPEQWKRLLTAKGSISVRGTERDGYFVGLWLDKVHGRELYEAGFDAGYTYFAATGFSYGSTPANWDSMAQEALDLGFKFMPCVGPGYDDSKIRPWNKVNRRERKHGNYYTRMWHYALKTTTVNNGAPPMRYQHTPSQVLLGIGITSYNEWGEGTQIESATAKDINLDYCTPREMCLPLKVRNSLMLQPPDRYDAYGADHYSDDLYMKMTMGFSEHLFQMYTNPNYGTGQPGWGVTPIPEPTPRPPPREIGELADMMQSTRGTTPKKVDKNVELRKDEL